MATTPPTRLETEATTSFDKIGDGFRLTKMELEIEARSTASTTTAFRQAAEGAKENCPVSKALEGNVEISVEATLASPSPAQSG